MRIINASANGGQLFTDNGDLLQPEWPTNGHRLCPHQYDKDLFDYLEQATWCNGKIVASARWWKRNRDHLHKGSGFVKDTFDFRGSGIHFYHLDGDEIIRENLYFLCEIPWMQLLQEEGDSHTFIGGDKLYTRFLVKTEEALTSANQSLLEAHRMMQERSWRVDILNSVLEQ